MNTKDAARSSPVKVLLVDDEVDFTNILAKRMGKRGFAVTESNSGSHAIRILRKHDYHVAVIDLKMEDMNGIEVLRFFKKMVPEMPVIMLTGHGSEEAAREGMKLGAFDYLMKPCVLSKLLEKIMEAIE